MNQLETKKLSAGYNGSRVLEEIDLSLLRGKMTGILGPNGSGKTTLLKTLANLLPRQGGMIEIAGKALGDYRANELAKEMAAVLTDRVILENCSCYEVAAMGRHPHTGFFGILSEEDRAVVDKSLASCAAGYLAEKPFDQISEGEKQKVLIARGLAQNPELLLLDEPTSHLDIRYKLEILTALRRICVQERKTVVCTLHEPDLAVKCCDLLLLVRDGGILQAGPVGEIAESGILNRLYGLEAERFDALTGSVEFAAPQGKDVFVIGSDSGTRALLRRLAGAGLGFGIGVLHDNDAVCGLAHAMGAPLVTQTAYTPIDRATADRAAVSAAGYRAVIAADFPVCAINRENDRIVRLLEQQGKTVFWVREWKSEPLLEAILELCNRKNHNIHKTDKKNENSTGNM